MGYIRIVFMVCLPLTVAAVLYFPARRLRKNWRQYLLAVFAVSFLTIGVFYLPKGNLSLAVITADFIGYLLGWIILLISFHSSSRWLRRPAVSGSFLSQSMNPLIIHLRHLVQVGIVLENRGAKFYKDLSKKTAGSQEKKLFSKLADDELVHRQVLNDMIERWLPLPLKPEVIDFFENKINGSKVFSQPPEPANSIDILSYAMAQEEKMTQFYRSFEENFPDSWRRDQLTRLVKEEESHKHQLNILYQALSK